MDRRRLDELIAQIESYLDCWKQFNNFLSQARTKKFGADDEAQFLELKALLAQQLEIILAAVESSALNRDEVVQLVGGVPSLRFLSEQNEGVHRNFENQWHKIYIAWQSILGQLKVQQNVVEPKRSFWSGLFGGKG
jgi:hypothetical protein